MAIPKKVRERLVQIIRKFIPIIKQQLTRDVSEADTVTLVKDLLADALGYDKYSELTGEYAIRGTYCDLAVVFNSKIAMLIEVKAIGINLDAKHVKQAIDYAANEGVEWVILTNARKWRLYHVIFAKPIDKRLVFEVDLEGADMRKDATLDALYAMTKEGFTKGAHIELKDFQDATSKYVVGALLIENDAVVSSIRRELKRVVNAKVTDEDVKRVMLGEIFKRDITEGQEWKDACRMINRKEKQAARKKTAARVNATKTVPVTTEPVKMSPVQPPTPKAEPEDSAHM